MAILKQRCFFTTTACCDILMVILNKEDNQCYIVLVKTVIPSLESMKMTQCLGAERWKRSSVRFARK